MTIHIVRLGSPRLPDEGIRIGTARRPPRGIPKSEFASGNWYDVWYPNLAPSQELVAQALQAQQTGNEADWKRFVKHYRAEMATPENRHTLDLLAALSHSANFSVGCYCVEEACCHRSVLRELLREHGAKVGAATGKDSA